MTDQTPRERVSDAIQSVFSEAKWVPEYTDMADGVIAHLWERADDPDVIEAVAELMMPTAYAGVAGTRESLTKTMQARSPRVIAAVLTALIGPRPGSEGS